MKLDRREQLKAKKQAYVQDEIIASAVTLFAGRGFRAVTIDDIAANLGYTKSVVYYYFKSKNEILWQIFDRIYDSYLTTAQAVVNKNLPPEDAFKEIIRNHALHVMEHQDWTAIYNREESELDEKQRKLNTQRRREYDRLVRKVYEEGVESGVFKDIPSGIAIAGILGMCNWLYRWYDSKGKATATEIAAHYVDMLTGGYMRAAEVKTRQKVAAV
jgi:TetR/AcrR family transcriptional regulator, cholesterol catabolism regulator